MRYCNSILHSERLLYILKKYTLRVRTAILFLNNEAYETSIIYLCYSVILSEDVTLDNLIAVLSKCCLLLKLVQYTIVKLLG